MRFSFLIAVLLLAIAPSTTRACLNDRDIQVGEQEFRSEYLQNGEHEDNSEGRFPLGWIAASAGGLLTIASVVALRRSERDLPHIK